MPCDTAVLYRPQEVLTGGHGWPASRAGVASRGAWVMVAVPIATGRTPAELRAMARRERDGRVSSRLLALANALDGMSRDEAARARRHGPADPARPGPPPRRGRGRGPARPAAARPALRPGRGPASGPEGPGPAGPEAGARRPRRLARPRPARAGRASLRDALRRERG